MMDFLREKWIDVATGEHGEEIGRANPSINRIADLVEGSQKLEKQFEKVKKSILRYAEIMQRFLNTKSSYENIGAADQERRLAHEALISNLNILSRWCAEERIPNNWRERIGDSRTEIGEWALMAAKELGE
jgi:hypothetical protein